MASTEETVALLDRPTTPEPHTNSSFKHNADEKWSKAHRTSLILFVPIIFCLSAAITFTSTPLPRLYKTGLCHDYYRQRDPNGIFEPSKCDIDPIQEDLSRLQSRLSMIEGLLAPVFVLPYAVLAEQKGLRLVFMLNTFGQILSLFVTMGVAYFWRNFTIETVVVASLLKVVVGGGYGVMITSGLALISNVSTSSQRLTVFFLVTALEQATAIVLPHPVAALMSWDRLYTTILLGCGFLVLIIILVYLVPVDTPRVYPKPNSDDEIEYSDGSGDFLITWRRKARQFVDLLAPSGYLSDGVAMKLVFVFAMFKIGAQLLQHLDLPTHYMTDRFGWRIEKASGVSTAVTLASMIFSFSLPLVKYMIQRGVGLKAVQADWIIATVSSVLLVVGSLILGLGYTVPVFVIGLVIFVLGGGAHMALTSSMAWLADRKSCVALYAYIALGDSIGLIMGEALVKGVLQGEIDDASGWLGLPYFVVAAAFLSCLTIAVLPARK